MNTFLSAVKSLVPGPAKAKLWDLWYYLLANTTAYRKKTRTVTMEVASVCNVRCEVCYIPHISRKGLMTLESFKVIFDKLPSTVTTMRMNYAGEPLLNKDVFKMINYTKIRRPDMAVHVSTNGTLIDRFNLDEIIDSGADTIAIDIDGASRHSHETYMADSDFEKICANTKALCARRGERNLKTPIVIMQTLLNAVNIGELAAIKKLAGELGVDKLWLRYMVVWGIINGAEEYPKEVLPLIDIKSIGGHAGKYLDGLPEEYSYYEKVEGKYRIKQEMKRCYSFLSPLILCNGDVTVCCHDGSGDCVFGNLIKESFEDVIERLPARKVYEKDLPICKGCVISRLGINYKELVPPYDDN